MADHSFRLLEQVCRRPDADAWQRLVEVYTPLLRGWLRRYEEIGAADAEDLMQDVLLAAAKEMPAYVPGRATGAFRSWLRTILVHRLRHFWRGRQHRPVAVGGSDFAGELQQLEDGGTPASQLWDRDHDRRVLGRLLEMAEVQFAPATWQAFRRQVLDGRPADAVAVELNMPLHSVYAAKSRVLHALRTLARGLVDG